MICDDDYYRNDEKMDEDGIPDHQEPMFAHRSDMWPKGRNDNGSSARTLRVYFIDSIPLKECWRQNGSPDLISTDYILETANKWNACDPLVPFFKKEDRRDQSDIRICFKGRYT